MMREGDTAPAFTLPGTDGDEVDSHSLEAYLDDGPVVLAFYVFDFHPACTTQMCSLRDLNFFELMPDAQVLGVSTDSAFSHRAFADEHDLDFVLLADNDGSVSEAYGVLYDELHGHRRVSRRAVFIVDRSRTVRYAWVADEPPDQPDWTAVKEHLDALPDGRG